MKTIYILILFICAIFLFLLFQFASDIQVTFSLTSPNLNSDSSVYVTGNLEQLGLWQPDKIKMDYKGNYIWNKSIFISKPAPIEYKYTLGSWQHEAADSNGLPLSNFFIQVSRDTIINDSILFWTSRDNAKRKSTITGTVKYHRDFKGDNLLPRDILVWLPPDYEKDSTQRFPVVYMQDGQNVFDASTSSFGNEWRADEICDSLIKINKIPPVIIVAVNNTTDRSEEYIPGEKGQAYMHFMVKTLKPFIDSTYRTKSEPEHTIVGGSSAGGTISFMLAWEYPYIFSKVICMSPALKIQNIDYVKIVKATSDKKDVFLYIDNGGIDLETKLQPGIDEMIAVLKEKDYRQGKDFEYFSDPTALHNEVSWAERFPKALELILNTKESL